MPTKSEMTRARAMFVRIFGPHFGEALMDQLRGEAAEFNAIVMCRIAPEIWDLPELDVKYKIMASIAIFTALNRDEVMFFIRAAIYQGFTRKQIEEVVLLAGLETGFPNAAAAQKRINQAYADHETFMRQHAPKAKPKRAKR